MQDILTWGKPEGRGPTMRCRRARESLAIDAADKPKANVCVTLPTSASASVPLPSVLFGTESRAAALPWNPDVSNVRACHLSGLSAAN